MILAMLGPAEYLQLSVICAGVAAIIYSQVRR